MMDWLRDIPAVQWENLQAIPDIIRSPGANPTAAITLLIITVALLLILGILWALLMYRPAPGPVTHGAMDEEPGEGYEDFEGDEYRPDQEAREPQAAAAPREPESLGVRLTRWIAVPIVVGAALFVLTGVTTSSTGTCISCHEDRLHAQSVDFDPHIEVSCVSCHEVGGAFARVTTLVSSRVWHFSAQPLGLEPAPYGRPISSVACSGCHQASLSGVREDEERGVRNKHDEPLAAGAQCVDCHRLEAGIVTERTVGMAPCLRCHDGVQASAECSTCHTKDPAQAIRSAATTPGAMAARQVPDPGCDGCHDQVKEGCDDCHGIRLPHTPEFSAWAHARPAAEDLWDNGGQMCGRCHYEQRRSCTLCHERFLAHAASWQRDHGVGISYRSGCGCHDQKAYVRGRQFCVLCHETRPKGSLP